MTAKNILLICGTLNQTKAMLAIGGELAEHNCYYTPFYCEGHLLRASQRGQLDFTVLAGRLRERSLQYMYDRSVSIDDRGEGREYDLVVTCTDLILQSNIKDKRIVLVQEGLTEPEGFLYWLVKHVGLPRVFANTAAFGLSDAYEVFCVASEGARELFQSKGVSNNKMVTTGIPGFDHVDAYRTNDFRHTNFVLVCTSNARETFKYDDRLRFLRSALHIAAGRPVIFKLHPTENVKRATREIRRFAPDAPVYSSGNVNHMIANASVVITQQSTCTFVAVALGKEVHTNLDTNELKRLMPIQNGGVSAKRIACLCQHLLRMPMPLLQQARKGYRARAQWERMDLS